MKQSCWASRAPPDAYSLNDEFIGLYRKHDPIVFTAHREARKTLQQTFAFRPLQVLGKSVNIPMRRLDVREFEHIVDNYRHAIANQSDLDLIWNTKISSDLTDAEKAAVLPHIKKAASARNTQAEEFRQALLARGLVNEDDFLKGPDGNPLPYTPQFINMEEASLDRNGLKDLFRMMYSREPHPDFLVERGFVEGVEEIGPDGEKVIRPTKAFFQLDPEAKEEAAAAWVRLLQQQGEEVAQQAADEARQMAKAARAEALTVVVEKMANKVRRLRGIRDKHADTYHTTMAHIQRVEGSKKV